MATLSSLHFSSPTFASDSVRFVVYGENQTGVGDPWVHKNLLERMAEEKPDLILHTGDLVAEGDRKRQWRQFLSETRDFFSRFTFRPAVGAQDRSKSDFFLKYFGAGREKRYYAFEQGPAAFIVLDTTHNFAPGSPQYRFLTETLESWKGKSPLIVSFYHPPFSGSRRGGDEKVEEYLVPLFEKYGVDLVLSGEERSYQRIGPINGVLYLVTGGGGAPLFPVEPNPAIARYKVLFHYIVIEADGKVLKGRVKDVRGVEVDRFEISHLTNPVHESERGPHPKLRRSTRYFKKMGDF